MSPEAALRPCSQPGCPALVRHGMRTCASHGAMPTASARRIALDRMRGSARSRGYTKAWERARLAYLQKHPLCAHCEARGFVTAGQVVDHVVPHRGNAHLFWLEANWQTLCHPCDRAKKPRENGLAPCPHDLPAKRIDGELRCCGCGERRQ